MEVLIKIKEYIELLEIKLIALKYSQEQDSSWNYGINELETKISELKKEYRY